MSAVLLGGVVAAGVARSATGSSGAAPWAGAPEVGGPAVTPGPGPDRYRIVYRVDAGNPMGASVTTEVLAVVRPWASRLTTLGGPPPGRRVVEDQVSGLGRLQLVPASGATTVLALAPDLAADDLRLDGALARLERAGAVQVREQREVAGRPCRVYRTSGPPQGQSLGRLRQGARDDWTDTCVDRSGLVLAQVRYSAGRPLVRTIATRVDTSPTIPAASLMVTAAPTVPTDQGGGAVTALGPSTPEPGFDWSLPAPPAGFVPAGSYAVAYPAAMGAGEMPSPDRRAAFERTWVRGDDVLLLDEGGDLYGGTALPDSPLGSRVALGLIGTGQAVPGARLSEVTVSQAGGRYVRLAGTLPVDQLVALARTLRPTGSPGAGQ